MGKSHSEDKINFNNTKMIYYTPNKLFDSSSKTTRIDKIKIENANGYQNSSIKNQKSQKSSEKGSNKKVHFSDDHFEISHYIQKPQSPNKSSKKKQQNKSQIPPHNPILNPDLMQKNAETLTFFNTPDPILDLPQPSITPPKSIPFSFPEATFMPIQNLQVNNFLSNPFTPPLQDSVRPIDNFIPSMNSFSTTLHEFVPSAPAAKPKTKIPFKYIRNERSKIIYLF